MAQQTTWTQEQVIAVLQDYQQSAPVPWTRKAWNAQHLQPSVYVIQQLFGSWSQAWQAVGVTMVSRKPWTSDQIIAQLQATHQQYGRWLTMQEWTRLGIKPDPGTVIKVLGTWRDAWCQAGFEAPAWNKFKNPRGTWNADRVLQALRAHARADGTVMGVSEWARQQCTPNHRTIIRYYGSYAEAVAAAGLTVITHHAIEHLHEQEQRRRAWATFSEHLGHVPSRQEWDAWPDRPVASYVMAEWFTFRPRGKTHLAATTVDLDYLFDARLKAWIEAYRQGDTLADIGRRYALSRERIRQGIHQACRQSQRQCAAARTATKLAIHLDPRHISHPTLAQVAVDLQKGVPIAQVVAQSGIRPSTMVSLFLKVARNAESVQVVEAE